MRPSSKSIVGLSFDVEDLENGLAWQFGGSAPQPTKVADQLDDLLSVLEAKQVKATFFVVGSCAREWKHLLRRLDDAGHEIGIHGVEHRSLHQESPAPFREGMRQVLDEVRSAIGSPVLGHRAPFLSLDERTYWLIDVLRELGFAYDSSMCPVLWNRFADRRRDVFRFHNGLYEVPVTVATVAGMPLVPCGGGYFRWLPYPYVRSSVERQARARSGAVTYFHNYDFADSDALARVRSPKLILFQLGLWTRLLIRSAPRAASVRAKFMRLLEEFECRPLRALLRADGKEASLPTMQREVAERASRRSLLK